MVKQRDEVIYNMSKLDFFACAKTKTQVSCAVTAQLISAFVFATWIIKFLFFLNPKFQASFHRLWLHSLVCVRPGFLAHLSRRLTGELIVCPCSGVRRPSSVGVRRRSQFQRSSPLKPLGQSKPNFMWSILRKGERKFI